MQSIAEAWRTNGFVILPAFLPERDLAPALDSLESMFPKPDGFHDGTDPRRARYLEDEFDGIDSFPFPSVELSLLAVHPRLVQLAEELLGQPDIRLSSAEAWAKYTGATCYDKDLHRDYLNQTLLVPTADERFQQLELFVFLVDVPEGLGPPHLVPLGQTADLPLNPNFYPRSGGIGDFVSTDDDGLHRPAGRELGRRWVGRRRGAQPADHRRARPADRRRDHRRPVRPGREHRIAAAGAGRPTRPGGRRPAARRHRVVVRRGRRVARRRRRGAFAVVEPGTRAAPDALTRSLPIRGRERCPGPGLGCRRSALRV